eukprot:1269277-Prymnesium_polylepis.1
MLSKKVAPSFIRVLFVLLEAEARATARSRIPQQPINHHFPSMRQAPAALQNVLWDGPSCTHALVPAASQVKKLGLPEGARLPPVKEKAPSAKAPNAKAAA